MPCVTKGIEVWCSLKSLPIPYCHSRYPCTVLKDVVLHGFPRKVKFEHSSSWQIDTQFAGCHHTELINGKSWGAPVDPQANDYFWKGYREKPQRKAGEGAPLLISSSWTPLLLPFTFISLSYFYPAFLWQQCSKQCTVDKKKRTIHQWKNNTPNLCS